MCKSCSRVHQSVRVCMCVYGCGCVSVLLCVSVCVCVRVIAEAFAVAAFLDTTFWFFSAAADPTGRPMGCGRGRLAGRQRFVAYFNFVVCSRKRKLLHCILWSSLSGRSLYLFLSPAHSLSLSFSPSVPFSALLCECGKFVILNFWQRHELLLSQRKVFTWRTQEAA